MKLVLSLFSAGLFWSIGVAENLPLYKICVPKIIHENCVEFLENPPSSVAKVQCVTGRDRMDCLEKVNAREADFLFAEPEDMYVAAYHLKNQDFMVFSELRSNDEPIAEFRYEGVILIRKESKIHGLADLKGKIACHSGYGCNAGYKMPINKLKKNGILKVSTDSALSSIERELKALSEFYGKACIVGNWSTNPETNSALKKRYSNLCEVCENPAKCAVPDKYSGNEGAIRCLDKQKGDVAFTKSLWVKKYFGLPIGNGNSAPKETAQGKPDDFEYLCEDGSRRPVTGPACSWTKRPWSGYMGHADVNARIKKLQNRIENFYTSGKNSPKTKEAEKMNIESKYLVVAKDTAIHPREYLDRAGYKDVIERDDGTTKKIRFCVASTIELKKCETLKQAAYSREIRPEFMCILKSRKDCITAVKNSEADIIAVTPINFASARDAQLKEVLHISFNDYVVVVPKGIEKSVLQKGSVKFNSSEPRSQNAALYLLEKLNHKKCPSDLVSDANSVVQIVQTAALAKLDGNKFELLCPNLERSTFDNFKSCNFEFVLSNAIFAGSKLSDFDRQNIIQAFKLLSKNFGRGGKNEQVFDLFGEFEKGQRDVIFNDGGFEFVSDDEYKPTVDEAHYKKVRCQ